MNRKFRQQYEAFIQRLDQDTAQNRMSQEDALDYLENLSSDVDARMDGLKDDIRNREEK